MGDPFGMPSVRESKPWPCSTSAGIKAADILIDAVELVPQRFHGLYESTEYTLVEEYIGIPSLRRRTHSRARYKTADWWERSEV